MPGPSTAILWFRRDLRLHDHPALAHALARYDRVVPAFVVDEAIVGGRWASANRRWFLAGALRDLQRELREHDSALTLVRGDPVRIVSRLAAGLGAAAIVATREVTPYGRRRDDAAARAAADAGVRFEAHSGLLVHDPEEIRREAGGPFTVFGPFHRRWRSVPLRDVVSAPTRVPTSPEAMSGPDEDPARLIGATEPTADHALLPEPGERAARHRLDRWAGSAALREYAGGRDRLDLDGTSRLSQDLRFGLLSPVEVLHRVAGDGPGPERFRSELAWRDFYAHLMWHEPRLARESFRTGLDAVAWSRAPAAIRAWKEGRTGYPVVDAAMRQLLATGWMHNRARMIVASFLTKHLGVDWRVGEAHFMAHPVDGDPASNNGGWQWAASTGTDPQPWFRIFNPTLQGRRHDPHGDYVRRWVPELAAVEDLPGPAIHEPPSGAYLPPVVMHRDARERALTEYAERASTVRQARTAGPPRRGTG